MRIRQIIALALILAVFSACNQKSVIGDQGVGEQEVEGIEEIKDSQRGGTPPETGESVTSDQESEEARLQLLQDAYDDARIVQAAVEDVWEEFDTQEQEALSEVVEVFSNDISLLKYYIEVAAYEQLTEEDEQNIVEIVIGIQDAIFILTQALDTLL